MTPRPFLAGMPAAELKEILVQNGEAAFRASQISDWIYDRCVIEPAGMKNLPRSLQQKLTLMFFAPGSRISDCSASPDGVEKLLLSLWDNESIEMVLIPSPERMTFCLSTQVGCPVRCRFCASGAYGLTRNLAAGEMLEEFLWGCSRIGRKPDNLVFMGIGEGMLNLDELLPALEVLTSPDGFGMSPRRLTVSTSGYVPGMKRFAELHREFSLAVSLHAPDDATRAKLIPDALRYPIDEILAAADLCRDNNGRQYTLEYTLIHGINDSVEQGRKLGLLAREHRAKVNLIPYNATGTEFRRPPTAAIEAFEAAVSAAGARVTRRMERGSRRSAACGQLRAQSVEFRRKRQSQEGDAK